MLLHFESNPGGISVAFSHTTASGTFGERGQEVEVSFLGDNLGGRLSESRRK